MEAGLYAHRIGPLPLQSGKVGFDLDNNGKGAVFHGVNDSEQRRVTKEIFTKSEHQHHMVSSLSPHRLEFGVTLPFLFFFFFF